MSAQSDQAKPDAMPPEDPAGDPERSSEEATEAQGAEPGSSGEASENPNRGEGGDAQEDPTESLSEAFERELVAARRKADENWDRFLRAEAELSNARKAAERARKEALSRQRRDLLSRFLEIADNLDRASDYQEADRQTLLEGLEGIRREVARVLEREGLARIDAEDADFDPNQHDAVAVVPMPGLDREKVIQVERPGYTLDGELLRPPRVVVGQPPEG